MGTTSVRRTPCEWTTAAVVQRFPSAVATHDKLAAENSHNYLAASSSDPTGNQRSPTTWANAYVADG